MSPLSLPAEGITLEYLAQPFRSIALQPIITGATLAASLRNPRDVARILSSLSKGKVSLPAFTRTIKVLFAVGVLYRFNNLFSKLVLNNWTSDRTWDWRKEIVIVTGGCSGIGELISSKLAENVAKGSQEPQRGLFTTEKNVKVVILDVCSPRISLPANTFFYQTDVTSSEAIAETAKQIRKDVGNPTVLIKNAGIGTCKPFLEETEAQIRATFNVNIVAHFLLTKEFLPYMIEKNHGHVVTMASLASFMVHASNIDYCCTKAGALAFHEGLAQELKHRYGADRVRTTVVHPTWVRTPLIETLSKSKDWSEFTIEPVTVANVVVAQFLKGESAQLIVPGRYSLLPLLRGAPSWLQEGVRNSVKDILRNAWAPA